MFEYLYEWLENLSFYLILVTAVTYALPLNDYRKYIRFFTGLVLIMMLLTPIFQLFRIDLADLENLYENYMQEYEKDRPMPENDGNNTIEKKSGIEVEEIVIGP